MTFTAVSAGELIKASIANANWRHVGRLGDNLLPMNTSGVATDDTYDLGSATYQWKDLYLSGTGKIYIGGVELSLGGGGGGGLESLALANAFEKNGMAYPLPSNKFLRNAFTSYSQMVIYLRKNYATADTTTMIADHGFSGELKTINDMQTVGDFTAGTSTPTVAANTSEFLENTQSIKFTATTLNGSADMYDAVTLSLIDRNFRVSVYPDTLTNVSFVYVVLYTSSGNQRKFDFAVANLTATAWNHLTCDLNLASGTTSGGVTVTDTGTFNRSNITRIYYGITTTSSQTVVPSFDLARAISDKPLLIPSYGYSMTIQDNTNQDSFTITAEDLTDYTTQGTYTIDATLGNAYTNINSTNYASSTTGTIQGGQFIHKSTASGQNAKTVKHHDCLALSTTLATGTLEAFLRFYDDAFEVDEFPTTGTINLKEISAAATEKGRFLDNDYILLFKKLQHGRDSQSPEGSHSINFLRLQLNANAGDSSDLITLSHDGSNSVGADTTGYYVVPESAYLEYSAGAKTASTFTQAVPSELIVKSDEIPYTSVPYIHSHWKLNELSGNAINSRQPSGTFNLTQVGTVPSTTGKLGLARGPFSTSNYLVFSAGGLTSTAYDSKTFWVDGWFKTSVTGVVQEICGKYNSDLSTFSDGWDIRISSNNKVSFNLGGSRSAESVATYTDGNWHYFFAQNRATSGLNELRLYIDGSLVDQDTGGSAFDTTRNFYVGVSINSSTIRSPFQGIIDSIVFGSTPMPWTEAETIIAQRYAQGRGREYGNDAGYTLKYNITDLTNVDKLETIITNKRGDTTNQNPVIYESGALLY